MKHFIFWLLIAAFFLLGCSQYIPAEQPAIAEPPAAELPAPGAEIPTEEALPIVEAEPVNLSCTLTADCEAGKQCINGFCGTLESFYPANCPSKCNFEEVVMSTSDGETYTLGPGQGSYTAAGALEWKLLIVPDYCLPEPTIVPVKIIAKNYGRIVGEYVLTLREGETSPAITHPQIPGIEFALTPESLKEECS